MSRLTEKDEQGNWCLKGIPWRNLYAGQTITKEISEKLYGALWKLMNYEDTGLTPEQMQEKDTPRTNADMFRSMTDEALAVTIMCPNEMGLAEIECDHSDSCNCRQCCLDWLKMEDTE